MDKSISRSPSFELMQNDSVASHHPQRLDYELGAFAFLVNLVREPKTLPKIRCFSSKRRQFIVFAIRLSGRSSVILDILPCFFASAGTFVTGARNRPMSVFFVYPAQYFSLLCLLYFLFCQVFDFLHFLSLASLPVCHFLSLSPSLHCQLVASQLFSLFLRCQRDTLY